MNASLKRSSPGLALVVVLTSTSILAAPRDADPNAAGFKLYQRGDYKAAHKLFDKALEKNAQDPYARLNHARTTTLLAGGKAPSDPCEFGESWIYLALADLSVAVEANAAAILPKIDEDALGLKALKEQPEYAKWRRAVKALGQPKDVLAEIKKSDTSWFFEQMGMLPTDVTLQKDGALVESAGAERTPTPVGKWVMAGDKLSFTSSAPKAKATNWEVKTEKYFFNEGKSFVFDLQLVPSSNDNAGDGWWGGPLRAGPVLADCN